MLGKMICLLLWLGIWATVDCMALCRVDKQVVSYVMKSDKDFSLKISSSQFMQQWKPERKEAWVIPAVSLSRLIDIQERLEELAYIYTPDNTVILYDSTLEPLMKDFAPGYQKFNLTITLPEEEKRTYDIITGVIKRCEDGKDEVVFLSEKIYKKGGYAMKSYILLVLFVVCGLSESLAQRTTFREPVYTESRYETSGNVIHAQLPDMRGVWKKSFRYFISVPENGGLKVYRTLKKQFSEKDSFYNRKNTLITRWRN